ncbi:MAG: inorganic pyrophosphatase [Alphaproteobacteria bacterium]|jgi:inorganic pyrophosphatase
MNIWHDVHYGKNAPESVTSVIEISAHSRTKYEIDKDTGLLMLDRVLFSSMQYPANYGFIPQTLGDDNDPLDVLVLSHANIIPMTLVNCRPVGVMHMIDGGEGDDKIICIAEDDVTVSHIQNLSDITPHLLKEIEHFFGTYKDLEKKTVQINGFGDKLVAQKIINKGIQAYAVQFKVD